jgi:LSD1 subclass zinc finger protein
MSDCGLCERELHGSAQAYLCSGCTRATGERLDRMPRLYVALAAFLQPGGRRPELGRARGAEAPLPVSEPVLNLRGPGGIVGILEDWRSAMQADRGWGPPAVTGTTEERVRTAARGLSLNLEWIASSWPMAGAFAEEIRNLERSVLSVVDPSERTRRLGNCIELMANGSQCGAVLRVAHGATEVRCAWCGAVWPPETWTTLARLQQTSDAA